MPSLIKQVFNVLSNFSSSLARVAKFSDRIKRVSLNDKPCIIRPTIIDLNTVELKYPFMISLDKCDGSCNVLSPKIYVPRKNQKT